jgi:hypothetical protein
MLPLPKFRVIICQSPSTPTQAGIYFFDLSFFLLGGRGLITRKIQGADDNKAVKKNYFSHFLAPPLNTPATENSDKNIDNFLVKHLESSKKYPSLKC